MHQVVWTINWGLQNIISRLKLHCESRYLECSARARLFKRLWRANYSLELQCLEKVSCSDFMYHELVWIHNSLFGNSYNRFWDKMALPCFIALRSLCILHYFLPEVRRAHPPLGFGGRPLQSLQLPALPRGGCVPVLVLDVAWKIRTPSVRNIRKKVFAKPKWVILLS